jgi:hypothetical protein
MLGRGTDVQTSEGWKHMHLMPGVPELKLWIQQHVFLDLTKAPFDTEDANLNPPMGACSGCPHRTGNQPALFKDVKHEATCTVPECFLAKRDASLVQLATSIAQELGVESVLKVGLGHSGGNTSKVPVDVYVDFSSSARIIKKGSECKHTQPGVITWIRFAHDAGSHKVGDNVSVCTQGTECLVHNKVDSRGERSRKSFEAMADTRITNLRESFPQRVRAALIRAVVESAQKERRNLSPAAKIRFTLMADQMHHDLYFDRHRDLCKLMGVAPVVEKPTQTKDWRGASANIFDGNPMAMMVGMTLMHSYHVGSHSGSSTDPLKPLLSVYKVDAKAVARKIKADVGTKIASIEVAIKKRKAKHAAAGKGTCRQRQQN